MIGKYIPTDETKSLLAKFGYPNMDSSSIELSEKGGLDLKHVPFPKFIGHESEPGWRTDMTQGRWKLIQHQRWWAISVDLELRASGDAIRRYVTDFMLIGNKRPYVIHITVGDPDSAKAMQFKKSER